MKIWTDVPAFIFCFCKPIGNVGLSLWCSSLGHPLATSHSVFVTIVCLFLCLVFMFIYCISLFVHQSISWSCNSSCLSYQFYHHNCLSCLSFLYICLSVCAFSQSYFFIMSICPSVGMSVCLSVCQSTQSFLLFLMSINSFVLLSACLSACQTVSLFVCLCLSISAANSTSSLGTEMDKKVHQMLLFAESTVKKSRQEKVIYCYIYLVTREKLEIQ